MWLELLLFCLSLLMFIFFREWYKIKNCGFPYLPYKFPFGHLNKVITRENSFGLSINEFYSHTEEPLVGLYLVYKPACLIRDPEIVKMILSTHFDHFNDRGMFHDKDRDPFGANLFAMEFDEWKSLRTKLTPAFSSGKMKQMFGQIRDTAQTFQDQISQSFKGQRVAEIPIKEISISYLVDVIGSVIFGIEVNSVKDSQHPFRGIAKSLAAVRSANWIETIRLVCMMIFPKIGMSLGIKSMPEFLNQIFFDLVKKTIEHRENSSETRHDVMQQLLQLRNTGSLDNENWTSETISNKKFLSIEECASNAFLFYLAGQETSSSTTCYCLYELSRHPVHMKRVQDEIDRVLKNNDGELTYEALMEMKFLEKCMMETLRIYPALPMLNRRCTKDFTIPGTNKKIFRNQKIVIPVRSIQTDAKYFPNPLNFNPNRCDPENEDYSGVPYHPFGEGPKSCIAYRLGSLMVRTGLVALLSKFNVERPTQEMEFNVGDLGMPPKDGFSLKFSLRERGSLVTGRIIDLNNSDPSVGSAIKMLLT